jgi:hypothetical protein
LGADGDSLLNLLIAADGREPRNGHPIAIGDAGRRHLVNQNELTDADHYFIPGQWTKGTIGRSFDQNRRSAFYTNAAIAQWEDDLVRGRTKS